ncbi:unnamed protein product [Ixodes persulcatus]
MQLDPHFLPVGVHGDAQFTFDGKPAPFEKPLFRRRTLQAAQPHVSHLAYAEPCNFFEHVDLFQRFLEVSDSERPGIYVAVKINLVLRFIARRKRRQQNPVISGDTKSPVTTAGNDRYRRSNGARHPCVRTARQPKHR